MYGAALHISAYVFILRPSCYSSFVVYDLTMLSLYRCILYAVGAKNPEETDDDDVMSTAAAPAAPTVTVFPPRSNPHP